MEHMDLHFSSDVLGSLGSSWILVVMQHAHSPQPPRHEARPKSLIPLQLVFSIDTHYYEKKKKRKKKFKGEKERKFHRRLLRPLVHTQAIKPGGALIGLTVANPSSRYCTLFIHSLSGEWIMQVIHLSAHISRPCFWWWYVLS